MKHGVEVLLHRPSLHSSPPPPLTTTYASNSPPFSPSNAVLMGKAVDHCLSLLEWALYMRKAHVPMSGNTKNSLQPIDGRSKICLFVPICYNRFNASRIHELKKPRNIYKFNFKVLAEGLKVIEFLNLGC